MGLRVIASAQFKMGKTVFALSMAELGPIGVLDSEGRWQHYTKKHPTIKPGLFPYHCPVLPKLDNAMCKNNPKLLAALKKATVIYVVQTKDLQEGGRAVAEWTTNPDLIGIVIDSGSVLWDLFQDTRDDSDPKTAMLSWTPIKKFLKRFHYSLDYGGKHIIETAHVQDVIKKVGSEFVTTGQRPWLEKKTPHWADMTISFEYPQGAKWPSLIVEGEGIGGAGGLTRGVKMENCTFGELVRLTGATVGDDALTPAMAPQEVEYRNKRAMEKIGKTTVPGVDDNPKLPG